MIDDLVRMINEKGIQGLKVKLIEHIGDAETFESKINRFLSQREVNFLDMRHLSDCENEHGETRFRVLVIYNERKDDEQQ